LIAAFSVDSGSLRAVEFAADCRWWALSIESGRGLRRGFPN
jgi:hypothetical protein